MTITIDLSWIIPFFNSPFFAGLATILTGSIAYLIYLKQKNGEKQKIARVIFIEILDCEKIFSLVKKSGVVNLSNIRQLPFSNTWSQCKYLFANDLNSSGISLVDDFFAECKLLNLELDEAYNLPGYWKEKARIVAERHANYSEETENKAHYEKAKEKLKKFEVDEYFWQPNFPTKQIVERIKNIRYVSSNLTGAKLQQIANL